ncbi:hypothetical protein ACOSQ3_003653 [Xanthoceras sorbifolium]
MAATLPLLVSALKPHSSHFSLFFAGARNPWLCLFKPPPERHRLVEIWSPRQIAPLQFNNHSVLRQTEQRESKCLANQRLQEFWALVGCAVMQCSNTE